MNSPALTITEEQFLSLRHGSVIQWGDDQTNRRTVLLGPADMVEPRPISRHGIHFPIKHRSWTGRLYTVYNWSELKTKIRYTGIEKRQIWSQEELLRLAGVRWRNGTVSAQLKADLEECFGAYIRGEQPWLQLKCNRFWTGLIRQAEAALNFAEL